MPILEVSKLQKTYRTRIKAEGLGASVKALIRPDYKSILAVNNISFQVEKGEMLAFIGPNGAGKSTTIKMLTGILQPTKGSMQVLGLNPSTQRRKLAMKIGTVFGQRSQLWLHLPPVDSFALLGAIYEVDDVTRRKRVAELTERFELGDLLNTPVRKLSLGQRIRCEVAASLLHEPEILFLDEPTIGLDVIVKQSIRQLIKEWNEKRGITVFLTSHDPTDVEQLCKRAIVIDKGNIIIDRGIDDLKSNYFNRKVITVKFDSRRSFEEMEGVVRTGEGYEHNFTVDTNLRPIGEVMSKITANGGVADITVTDPPMEDIISDIFSRDRGGAL